MEGGGQYAQVWTPSQVLVTSSLLQLATVYHSCAVAYPGIFSGGGRIFVPGGRGFNKFS
jgi:hypothetical protein